MKILFLSNIPAPYRVIFFNMLSKDNDVTVLFDKNNDENRNANWFKSNKYNFKYIWLEKHPYHQIKNILCDKYDIIINGNYASLCGAVFSIMLHNRRIPFIINADGGYIDDSSKIKSLIKTKFISRASYWLSTGLETDKYLIHYGAKKDKIYHYVLSSILKEDIIDKPVSVATKEELRKKYKIKNQRTFIAVGRFINIKGFDSLLKTINVYKIKNANFIIIGGGEEKNKYEQYIKENNIKNVTLIDFIDKKTLYDYYKLSDAFLMSTRGDVWGLVVNEAMSCGLPIISTNRCIAALELVSKDDIYEVDNEEQLSLQIKKYCSYSESQLKEKSDDILKIIKEDTIEAMVDKHNEIFKEIQGEINEKN